MLSACKLLKIRSKEWGFVSFGMTEAAWWVVKQFEIEMYFRPNAFDFKQIIASNNTLIMLILSFFITDCKILCNFAVNVWCMLSVDK